MTAKVVVGGGFAVGKTTFVSAVSEVHQYYDTEARLSAAGVGVDDLRATPGKTTTTVAMDYGRLTLADPQQPDAPVVLYLFGIPGQHRFAFMWEDLVRGAIGAVLLLDTRRPADSFPAAELFERHAVPFVVAVNAFPGSPSYADADIRDCLDLPSTVPVLTCDARDTGSSTRVLIEMAGYCLTTAQERP